MIRLFQLLTFLLFVTSSTCCADDKDPARILPAGQRPADSRLGKPKTLNDYFPFAVPADKETWEARRKAVRELVLVATGLWPMPEKTPLNPVIHGKIDRDEYTIEKVFFASYPGHYVSGNLYRPKGQTGRVPGVLCPHGHWPNGRFYDALASYGEKHIQDQIKKGAEKTAEGARYPLQARCAQLARMGCVVFHYDMVGYADSQAIKHRDGFTEPEAQLRLQSFIGLQTWNSIRSLDFLTSLPDVDPARIGVTGASGGGTQAFILCAVDDRPLVAFPAVMVSTAMQGGCICENCCYLRRGTGNIEIAGLFAPKPLGMSGANDWTKEIETKGLPELKALYRLYGAEDNVMAKAYPQFEHNYNQVSRELMYNWFNKHLHLGQPEPVVEMPFVPVPVKELSVYDGDHPRPTDAVGPAELRRYLTEMSEKQITALLPKDRLSLDEFRLIVGTALQTMVGDSLPSTDTVEFVRKKGGNVEKLFIGRKDASEQIPALYVSGPERPKIVVVWIHPRGKASLFSEGKLVAAAQQILDRGAAILAPDVYMTGEFAGAMPVAVDKNYAGFTFGYNRSRLANRVRDVLTAIVAAKGLGEDTVHLIGFESAGPWVVLARALSGEAVSRTAADLNQFRFENVHSNDDEMMLPGALKYGGLPAFAALCAPGDLLLRHSKGTGAKEWLPAAYHAAGCENVVQHTQSSTDDAVVRWLLR
jgi:dienelactone hydrolase